MKAGPEITWRQLWPIIRCMILLGGPYYLDPPEKIARDEAAIRERIEKVKSPDEKPR